MSVVYVAAWELLVPRNYIKDWQNTPSLGIILLPPSPPPPPPPLSICLFLSELVSVAYMVVRVVLGVAEGVTVFTVCACAQSTCAY